MKRISLAGRQTGCCEPSGSPAEPVSAELEDGARLFRALGDETRLNIVRRLAAEGEVCACELACCGLAQPTVSHHLKVLREAGLVSTEKRGLWVYCTLNRKKLAVLRSWLP